MNGDSSANLQDEIAGLRRRVAALEGAASEQVSHALRTAINASPLAIVALDPQLPSSPPGGS